MKTSLAERPAAVTTTDPSHEVLDPLGGDRVDDRIVVTTERAISRVALVAAETGARFQRDAVPHDAMAWMLSPRRVFGGTRPIDACLKREDCVRGILVHGLGLGLDVRRSAVNAVMADDGDDDGGAGDEGSELDGATDANDHPAGWYAPRASRLRLFTATIADVRGDLMVQAFHASMAGNVREVRSRLVGRYGAELAAVADIRPGLPQASPIVVALVPAAVAELIRNVERDAAAPTHRFFAVDIQHCVRA